LAEAYSDAPLGDRIFRDDDPNLPVFELDQVSYRYPTGTPALDEVACAIYAGQSVAVLGANGSGKSTLLRLLDGLVTVSSGILRAWGEPLTPSTLEDDHFARALRRRIGFVFQDADSMLFSPTVAEEVAFGPTLLGLTSSLVEARVRALLERCSLTDLADRAPYELSGGEKRRVCLAAALSTEPPVLLFDEPTTGLDPRSRDWLIDMMLELHERGNTLLLATHDLAIAAEVTKRALVLGEDHRLRADRPTEAILADRSLLLSVNLISERRRTIPPVGVE